MKVYMRDLLQLAIKNANEKTRMDIMELVPMLVSQIKNLEELGVTSDKCEMVLYPVVESCLPDDVLQAWQRHATYAEKLDKVVSFLSSEVQNKMERNLARMDFSTTSSSTVHASKMKNSQKFEVPTASALLVSREGEASRKNPRECIFCGGRRHSPGKCFKARQMTFADKMEIIRKKQKQACYICLRLGHKSSDCQSGITCSNCQGKHFEVMCKELSPQQQQDTNSMMMVPMYKNMDTAYQGQPTYYVPQQQMIPQQQQLMPSSTPAMPV